MRTGLQNIFWTLWRLASGCNTWIIRNRWRSIHINFFFCIFVDFGLFIFILCGVIKLLYTIWNRWVLNFRINWWQVFLINFCIVTTLRQVFWRISLFGTSRINITRRSSIKIVGKCWLVIALFRWET